MNTTSYVKFWEEKKLTPYQITHPGGFSNNNILPNHQWITNAIFVSAWRFNEWKKGKTVPFKIYLKAVLTTLITGTTEEKFVKIPYINFDNLEEEGFLVYRGHEVSIEHFSSDGTIFYLTIRIKDSHSFYCMEYALSNFVGAEIIWPELYHQRKPNGKKTSDYVLCVPHYNTANMLREHITEKQALEITDELKDDKPSFSFEKVSSLDNEEPFSWNSEFCTFKYQKENLERSEQYLSKNMFRKSSPLEYETVSKEVKLMTKEDARSQDLEIRSCEILTPVSNEFLEDNIPVFESTEDDTDQSHDTQTTSNPQVITRNEMIGLTAIIITILLLTYVLYRLIREYWK